MEIFHPNTQKPSSQLLGRAHEQICPLVSIRNVLAQSPKCVWKRVWGEEKGLVWETPKEVGGCRRAPGVWQGLR